jgi:hypothetical protein
MVTDNGRIWRTRFAPDTPCTVSLELQNGDIIDWRNYQANYDLLGLDKNTPHTQLLSQYIHISAYITRVMPLPMPQFVRGTSRCYYLEADLEGEHEDSPPIRVDIKSTAQGLSSFCVESYVLHLPWYLDYGHDRECRVLVVQRKGSHWERVGTGMTSVLLEAAPVKKLWTTIRLG